MTDFKTTYFDNGFVVVDDAVEPALLDDPCLSNGR